MNSKLQQSSNEEEDDIRKRRKRKKDTPWQITGLTIQIVLFIANAAVWIISILAIIGGFIVGLNTKTINIRLELLDLTVTTPATIFITYGIIIVTAAILGCFTATGGNKVINIGYIILLIIVLIFDGVLGVCAFFSTSSLLEYMQSIRKSMNDYGKDGVGSVGIFKINPTVYWDHLQSKGQCCGLDSFEDWRNTTLGREKKSVPDTCCNAEYEYVTCGNHIFHHPDTEHHEAQDIIYTRGCLKIFPAPLISSFQETVYVGILLGSVIIFCLLLAIILLILVSTKKYSTGGGPEFRNQGIVRRRQSHERDSEFNTNRYSRLDLYKGDEGLKGRRRDRRKVGPAAGDTQRDTQRLSISEQRERKVSFEPPSFIPKTNNNVSIKENRTHEATVIYSPQQKDGRERRRNSD